MDLAKFGCLGAKQCVFLASHPLSLSLLLHSRLAHSLTRSPWYITK
jgi:hypothetical protein